MLYVNIAPMGRTDTFRILPSSRLRLHFANDLSHSSLHTKILRAIFFSPVCHTPEYLVRNANHDTVVKQTARCQVRIQLRLKSIKGSKSLTSPLRVKLTPAAASPVMSCHVTLSFTQPAVKNSPTNLFHVLPLAF